MKKKIAIQGFEGSFHQSAAIKYYGKEVEVICCSTFREVVKVAGDSSISDGGLMAIEKDVEAPHESEIFKKYPTVGSDHHVIEFTTDYLRMMVSGNLNSHEIEALMDSEIDTHHQEAHAPVAALARLAGALPAFGIVAAVLGVVNTMGSVGQPPSVLGGMIGSALVGTFLGILLAYGVVEPLGGLVEQKTEDAAKELQCIKSTLLASMQGYNPATAIEFGRKVLFSNVRPSFSELEGHVKGKK